MRINPECVRTIILAVESKPDASPLQLDSQNYVELGQLGKFDFASVCYHIEYCKQKRWLCESFRTYDPVVFVSDLTPEGHDFADNIRDDKKWNKAVKLLLATSRLTAVAFLEAAAGGFAGSLF